MTILTLFLAYSDYERVTSQRQGRPILQTLIRNLVIVL